MPGTRMGSMTVHGAYLEVDRPHKLGYTWNPSWQPGEETEVHLTFEPIGERTRVHLVHPGSFAGLVLGIRLV